MLDEPQIPRQKGNYEKKSVHCRKMENPMQNKEAQSIFVSMVSQLCPFNQAKRPLLLAFWIKDLKGIHLFISTLIHLLIQQTFIKNLLLQI